ncbi:DUF971 domain-containing protein [Marinobacter salinexigens]|uniref:DUF971 domain-containing protein n=1 Tax=Marinobacter salinexigens TaxID=2919747 RepID=A0A5B0VF64_9GAMM|nr:gamma-butyrobetaine hydroxylase-like domain-containing protein [Marinobacter salinexigens]KAA1172843.1 DUF971 domain-containing protein [Marinobacter salinexigens]
MSELHAIESPVVEPPTEVRVKRRQNAIEITWPDGLQSLLSSLALRKSCACSHCTQAQRNGRVSLIDADVRVDRVELSGVSGLQFFFTDGHYRGLYPWAYLRELSERVS